MVIQSNSVAGNLYFSSGDGPGCVVLMMLILLLTTAPSFLFSAGRESDAQPGQDLFAIFVALGDPIKFNSDRRSFILASRTR
jgi:hypothetical protein